MKPLQSIAMGLVIIVLSARFGGYDALPDPVGWVLILLGTRALPDVVMRRESLQVLGALAAVVSIVLWFPSITEGLYDADASLGWAANLPQIGFTALLCHELATAAAQSGDGKAASWLGLTRTVVIVVGVLPVLVFGAGWASFEITSYLAAGASAVLLIWLLFAYAQRPWAGAAIGKTVESGPDPS